MIDDVSRVYNFVYRAVLTQESLDTAGRQKPKTNEMDDAEVADLLSIHVLNEDFVARARGMATVYVAIAAFENSVRELISKTLLESKGADWWEQGVSEKNKKPITKANGRRAKGSLARSTWRRSNTIHNATKSSEYNEANSRRFCTIYSRYGLGGIHI
ncbi:hypothetical protein [Caulobacter sp. Root1455]|uniref:hypothetical protein n=1 Tax=Caulobacter sp. Root1455 TaxID=1736465 RepID=UPI0012E3554F|nr:hypothetical protein [Caulobacter sp. Root1455]